MQMQKILNYINGKLQEPKSGKFIDNVNPATGEVYSLIPDSDSKDVEEAVEAAQKAFPGWAALPAEKRSAYMLKVSGLIEQKLDELALAEANDNGKPLWLAKAVDIPRASQNFAFFATAILHEHSEAHQTDNL